MLSSRWCKPFKWLTHKSVDEFGLPAHVKRWVLLAWLLAMLSSPVVGVWMMMSFPRWSVFHRLGDGQEHYESAGSRLSRDPTDGRIETPQYVPERWSVDPRFAAYRIAVMPEGRAVVEPSREPVWKQLDQIPSDQKPLRSCRLDISWQYRGQSLFAPMRLERIVAAEFIPSHVYTTYVAQPGVAVTVPLTSVPPQDLLAMQTSLAAYWKEHPAAAPADRRVRAWFSQSLTPGWFSLGHDIIWGGVAANLLLLASVCTALLSPTMLVLLLRRKWRRARALHKLRSSTCPHCRYSLVNLRESSAGFVRCPECGHELAMTAAMGVQH